MSGKKVLCLVVQFEYMSDFTQCKKTLMNRTPEFLIITWQIVFDVQ